MVKNIKNLYDYDIFVKTQIKNDQLQDQSDQINIL